MQENNLIYATPESQGVPSEAITDFLDELEQKRLIMHSFILLRHGKVIAEGYWNFFGADRLQRMYSISKSFTSVAIGMMTDEGKISLGDKIVDFFPEYLPENPHPHMLEATVRDLLMMASFHNSIDYATGEDWIKPYFQDTGRKHRPGTLFSYDTGGTVVLCGIVEKLSGKPILEYMRPVLDAIGISKEITCIKSPDGRSWTGSGILCTTRDLARFALFCMNKGEWNGKQLVSREYMEAAVSKQIDNSISSSEIEFQYGYGYKFWMIRNGGFACFGLGGQFALCMPEHDVILVTTADNQAVSGGAEHTVAIFHRLIDKINKTDKIDKIDKIEKTGKNALPENEEAQKKLLEKISSLSIPLPQGSKTTKNADLYSGKRYITENNGMGLKWLSMDVRSDECTLNYANNTGEHSIIFGMGEYRRQKFPEKYFGRKIGVRDTHYDTIAAGAWNDDNTFCGTVYSIDEHKGTLKMQFTFSNDNICVFMAKAAEWFFDDYQGIATGWSE